MPLSNSLDDVMAADTGTRCQILCLHLVFGRQSGDEDGIQHVVVTCQPCCTHLCGKILDAAHLLECVAPRLYLETFKAPGEIGIGPIVLGLCCTTRVSHASLGEVHLCRILLSLLLLFLRAVDRTFHVGVCMSTLSRLYPLSTSTEFSVSNSPTGMYRNESDTKARNRLLWRNAERFLSRSWIQVSAH